MQKRIIECTVDSVFEGMRLDLYLSRRFSYRSRTIWQDAVSSGQILLNDGRTKPSRQLRCNDKISLIADSIEEPPVDRNYTLLMEEEQYMIVSKSGQIPVHPSGCYFQNTLLHVLLEKWDELYPVNRLDRETSGVVLLAKNKKAAGMLSTLFQQQHVQKKYIAYVHGEFPEQVQAKGYLSQDADSVIRKKRKFSFEPSEQDIAQEICFTEFKRIGTNGTFSIVECTLHTGRLHQIRATLQSLNFPIIGDKMYGLNPEYYLKWIESRLSETDLQNLRIARQALHADSVEFVSPFTGKRIFCKAPLPDDLKILQDEILSV